MINPLDNTDPSWLVLSAALVLTAQVGFACVEAGLVQTNNRINIAIKGMACAVFAVLAFWLIGFGVMAGNDVGGWMGTSLFAVDIRNQTTAVGAYFLFNAALCVTGVAVVSLAVAERMRFNGYLCLSLLVAGLIFPAAGHWVWARQDGAPAGWLSRLGFVDFAGSTALHVSAGAAALAAALVLGPRLGGFMDAGTKRTVSGNVSIAFAGLAFLLVAWFGLVGGSDSAFGNQVPAIIANLLLSAAAATGTALLVSRLDLLSSQSSVLTPLTGCLAGLVAICGGGFAVSSGSAVIIGVGAALAMSIIDHILVQRRIDDVACVVAVFLGAGAWGSLTVALFIDEAELQMTTRAAQLGVQSLGVVSVAVWSFAVCFVALKLINIVWPLRVSEEAELDGLDHQEHGIESRLQRLLKVLDKHGDEPALEPTGQVTLSEIGQTAERYKRVLDSIDKAVRKAQAIVRDLPQGVLTCNSEGIITSINPAAETIFGVASAEAIGRSIKVLFAKERIVRDDKQERLFGVLELNRTIETFGVHPGRESFRVEVTASQGEANGQQQLIVLVRDIHNKRQLEDQLFKEQERALVTLGSIADGVITTDVNGKVKYLNAAAERLTGWGSAEARGFPFERVFLNSEDQSHIVGKLQKVLAGSALSEDFNQTTLQGKRGNEQPVSYTLAPIKDQFGDTFGCVAVFHDVTSTQALQRKLSHQATHDDLTGVLNRNGFERVAQRLLNRSVNLGEQHVLGFMDLDQFKTVNDTCGHQAGDELLRQIAQLIKKQLRSDDTLARMGGDEFCILLQNCNEDNGLHIAEIIRDAIAAYRFSWEGKQFSVGASIGLVKITRDTPSLPKLMSLADSACYAAKDEGRNRVNLYRPNDLELAERRGQVEWIAKIRQALDTDSLRLFFQPIEPLQGERQATGHIEVFVHLLGENGKLVPPGAFIPAAERYSVIQEVDMWVVRNALAWLGDYQRRPAASPMVCSINLSGTTISDKKSLDKIIELIEDSQVDTQGLCFEITETAAIGNFEAAKRFIVALKEIGCSFSLDDFGSGLSSFGYLKNLPVDYLKIDGVFIKDILNNRVDKVMVDSITKLAHELGLKTVAEFVSSEAIAEQLRELGVDYGQGYFLAKPQPLHTLTAAVEP
ncbi:EAL domain-containing protein [Halioxenophilus aromaticivorans]|uniref:Diguanylate cyclase n=1 Tax=Halioxenophilus aromaticivorans TaxID=1306992 RepID=A0AAV3U0P7_9ALTE